MRLRKKAAGLLVLVILVTGCNARDNRFPAEIEFNPTKTEQSDIKTKFIPTSTEIVQPTDEGFSYQPFSRVEQFSEPETLSGTFVLSKDNEEGLYLLDAVTMQMIELSTGYISVSEMSPDQGLFAYETYTYENGNHVYLGIDIIDDSGEILQHVNSDGMTHSFMWIHPTDFIFNLGGENAPILRYTLSNQISETIYPYYDPDGYSFTGYDHFYSWDFFIIHKNVHNADFTRIVYPFADSENNSYVLRDTVNGIDLAEFVMDDYFDVAPKWSRDGELLALGVDTVFNPKFGYEIYIVDCDGNVILETDLAKLNNGFQLGYFSWSPDSQKLAFSYAIDENLSSGDYHLGVLDMNDFSTKEYDISLPVFPNLIWSSDSRFLLFHDEKIRSDNMKVFLFDTQNNELVFLTDEYIPTGWIKTK